MIAAALDITLHAAGLLIAGVSLGREGDKSTWRIDWIGTPTPLMLTQAQAVLDAFDPATVPAAKNQTDRLLDLLVARGLITATDRSAIDG
jgi:hypothetical protein